MIYNGYTILLKCAFIFAVSDRHSGAECQANTNPSNPKTRIGGI